MLEQVKITRAFFDQIGITAPTELDPYRFGDHGTRFYIWSYMLYVLIPEPKANDYLTGDQLFPISRIFKLLDTNQTTNFIDKLKNNYDIIVTTIPTKTT